ncbi:MAG: tetratricopeptide repeat protein [Cyanobacteria bacterium P01_G01_bin.49]
MTLACQIQVQPSPNLALRLKIKEKANQGNYTDAISLLDQLISSQPDSAVDYNNRGLMYLKLGEYDQAMADFNRSITLNPRLDRAYNNRANCQAVQGNLDEAIADYETALDLNPYNQRVWINQGITLRELEQYELAIETLEISLIMGEQYQGRIYAERGYTHYLSGDWNCAIADYYRALTELSESDSYYQKVEKWLENLLNPLRF